MMLTALFSIVLVIAKNKAFPICNQGEGGEGGEF
jgi:hypothetical protein